MTEAEWQGQVVDLAHSLGWKHLHVRRTIGKGKRWTTSTNVEGWPDLFLWHPRHGFAAIELKVSDPRNQADEERRAKQLGVLAQLGQAGARVLLAYPRDIDAVVAMLGGRASAPR